jgi:hypothetical protein
MQNNVTQSLMVAAIKLCGICDFKSRILGRFNLVIRLTLVKIFHSEGNCGLASQMETAKLGPANKYHG